ncbi:MAG: hypothetical protein RLZZ210_321 [Pseudomonadota bacterium]|jgi:hypothetical protein
MNGKYHWSNYYKRAELIGLSAYSAIAILASILRPFSMFQHFILFAVFAGLFYIEKLQNFIPQYFIKYVRTRSGGSLRKYHKIDKPT